MHIACKHNHAEIIHVLLRAGANPDAPSREGTPRDIAEAYHCLGCIDAIDDFLVHRHDDDKLQTIRRAEITSRQKTLGEHVDTPDEKRKVRFRKREHDDIDKAKIQKAKDDAEMSRAVPKSKRNVPF